MIKSVTQSLCDKAYEELANRLVSLRIRPGQHLSISALAREFGISQTPIRSALTLLEAEGMVERKHNSGFRVSQTITSEELAQIYSVRSLLEPEAAALAARNARQADIDILESLHQEMCDVIANNDKDMYGRFAILDRQFHHQLTIIGDNIILSRILSSIHSHLHLFRAGHHESALKCAVIGHRDILEAIIRRNSSAASNSMRLHISTSMKNALAQGLQAAIPSSKLSRSE